MKTDATFFVAAFTIGLAHLYPRLGLYSRAIPFWIAQAFSAGVGLYVLLVGSPMMNSGPMRYGRWILGFTILMRMGINHFNRVEEQRRLARVQRLDLRASRDDILIALRAGDIDEEEASRRLAALPVPGEGPN